MCQLCSCIVLIDNSIVYDSTTFVQKKTKKRKNVSLSLTENEIAENVVYLFLTSGLEAFFVSDSLYCQIQTRLIKFCQEGSFLAEFTQQFFNNVHTLSLIINP